ncbi:Phosphotransferase enzyme family protein [Apiospora arundinis]|uniref:Phosphotransferase enzyme family protein n=1 Tax=Apiospora arundinis TaxID=335852 RepID=A0ABR2ICE9_9PEZI
MLAIVYRSTSSPLSSSEGLRETLGLYGIDDVIDWVRTTDCIPLPKAKSPSGDLIFINADHALDNMVIRRLTLNSVRLPSTFTVWDGPSKRHLVAARIELGATDNLEVERLKHFSNLQQFRNLIEGKPIPSYKIQEISDLSSIRIGGSFAGSGISRYYGKSATGLGAKKLRDEARIYQSLPQSLRPYYPKLLFYSDDAAGVSMGTQYEDHPNLRDLLLNMDVSVAQAVGILKHVLEVEFCKVFLEHKQPVPENYLDDYHFHRVWRRIAISMDLDHSFGALVTAPSLFVNGERLPNVPAMLLRLEQDQNVASRLRPDGVSPFIHGDLHLENILYDVPNSRFWLVDPRGYPSCDIYYDLGKLAHSYNSCYDLLHEGRHTAESFTSVDGQRAYINYRITSKPLAERYAELNARMDRVVHDLLERHGEAKEDIDLRVRFNEAMHFCSDMPFHINSNAKPCIAQPIYAIGAKLLAEVLQMLGIDLDDCYAKQEEALTHLAGRGKKPWRFEG